MKKLTLTLLTFLLLLSPNVILSETWGDLLRREGSYYKKFSEVPFSGEITGLDQGTFKSGVSDGAWVGYHKNGRIYVRTILIW